MKYNKIVFLLGSHRKHPLLSFDYLDTIRSYNVRFEVWDIRSFNPLWDRESDKLEIMRDEYEYKFIEKFEDMNRLLLAYDPGSTIFHLNFELKFWLRKILRKITGAGFNYFIRSNQCALYGDLDREIYLEAWKYFTWQRALRIYTKSILTFFLKRLIRLNIPEPQFIFIGHDYDKILLEFYPQSKSTHYIYTHTNDCEKLIEFSKKEPDRLVNVKYFVFIDQFFGFHFEHRYFKTPFRREDYYNRIQTFLHDLESKFGVTVIVALHPSADIEMLRNYYKGFQLIKRKTAELIYHSSLVLAHDSASLSLAVLFQKPVAILMTRELVGFPMEIYIRSVATLLQREPVFVEDDFPFTENDFAMDASLCLSIQEKLLKRKESPMQYEWQIIMKNLVG